MDSKELRNLQEAYLDVYAPQENIEEGLRSAVKRLLGGGKKEAEAPKPESRGDQLRKKYNVGPEKSDTSAKRQILDRSRARAEKDEKDYGDKPFQKQVAQKSKAAHDRYLKAGYSKYGAGDARGSGSKAAKRAAALNIEEFEIIVNALIEEGYDLSSYTWDEMYEVCLDEAVKGASRHDTEMRKAASTERKAGIKNRLSPAAGKDNADKMQRDVKFFDKLTKKNRNVVGLVTKEEVEELDESGLPQDTIQRAVKERQKRVDAAYAKDTPEGDAEGKAGMKKLRRSKSQLDINKPREVRMRANEEVEQIDELSVNKMNAYINKAEKDRDRLNKKWDQGTATSKERKKVFDREEGEARASKKIRQKTGKDSFRLNALDKLKSAITKEEVEIFDVVLEYLVAEGYADTNESALVIMANMSEEWRESICEEVLDEGDNYDKNRQRAAKRAAERNAARDAGRTGNVPGVGYVTPRRERETYRDAAGVERHTSGARMPK
jgi:hypothetical protein